MRKHHIAVQLYYVNFLLLVGLVTCQKNEQEGITLVMYLYSVLQHLEVRKPTERMLTFATNTFQLLSPVSVFQDKQLSTL